MKNIFLYAKPGQKIAIVGATGSGKTTIVNLLTRFYEVDGGVITIDGRDITTIPKENLRRSIAIVLQDTVLFSDTIRNNIKYGRADATDEEMRRAARHARADTFIEALPDGYDTLLSEGGSNLWWIILLIVVVLAAVGAALWFFVFKKKDDADIAAGTAGDAAAE